MRTELCTSCTSFKSRAHFYKEKAFKRVDLVLWCGGVRTVRNFGRQHINDWTDGFCNILHFDLIAYTSLQMKHLQEAVFLNQ